jgi:hypothetical protein
MKLKQAALSAFIVRGEANFPEGPVITLLVTTYQGVCLCGG